MKHISELEGKKSSLCLQISFQKHYVEERVSEDRDYSSSLQTKAELMEEWVRLRKADIMAYDLSILLISR